MSQPGVAWLSLRAKGAAVLCLPLAALVVALFWLYSVDGAVRDADRAALRAYNTRAELLRLRALALDPGAPADAIRQSLDRLQSLTLDHPRSIGALSQIRAAAGGERSRMVAKLALLDEAQDVRLSDAQFIHEAARERLLRVVIVCGILGPLGGLVVHLLVAGRLVKRLGLVEENARRLAHGLPLDAVPRSSDEIGALARQIEDAAFRMRDRERELRESESRYRDL